jgi:hypothetical protein
MQPRVAVVANKIDAGETMEEHRHRMRSDYYIREAVVQLLALKRRTGSSLEELRSFVSRCVSDAARKSTAGRAVQGLDIHRLGSVLRAWHTSAKFLSTDGSPRALRLTGRNSLKTLIQLYYPVSKHLVVFERLRAAKLIKACGNGQWLPTGKHARISQLSYETLEHLSEGVARYVETVTKNVTATHANDVLFERSCKVTRLPSREFVAFRDYVDQQASAFITAIDDWLEGRNCAVDRKSKALRTAGVYTFAYIDRKP